MLGRELSELPSYILWSFCIANYEFDISFSHFCVQAVWDYLLGLISMRVCLAHKIQKANDCSQLDPFSKG